jgi:hypothetical protein
MDNEDSADEERKVSAQTTVENSGFGASSAYDGSINFVLKLKE